MKWNGLTMFQMGFGGIEIEANAHKIRLNIFLSKCHMDGTSFFSHLEKLPDRL